MARKRPQPPATRVPKEKVIELYRKALLADIPLELVQEKVSTFLERVNIAETVENTDDTQREKRIRQQIPWPKRVAFTLVPVLCIIFGLFLVGNAAVPILSYFLFTSPDLNKVALLAPIPRDQVLENMPKIIVQAQTASGAGLTNDSASGASDGSQNLPSLQPTIIATELDYTNLSNWFPTLGVPQVDEETAATYRLDIPTVDLSNAEVKIGGSNLDKSLIQYPGTALPGQKGAPVIFGHSILRQFYNPSEKNPRRYISVFSKIMTLKTGDKIYLTKDNVRYTYVVQDKREVDPEDTYILEQRYDNKTLKLVTCTPEGTTLHRGVIEAVLETTQ
jgi:LPXTG-site transpeptidase (sortase) family protein